MLLHYVDSAAAFLFAGVPGKHKGCNDDAVQQHASIEALETIESDGKNGCVIRYAWLVGRIVEAIATEMILLQHEPDVACI